MRELDNQSKSQGENYRTLIEQLKGDIKSSMSLAKASESYMADLRQEITGSPDLEIRSFVEMVSSGRRRNPRNLIMIAAGEMAFSALLLFLGLVFIVPAFYAYANPGVLLGYFSSFAGTVPQGSLASGLLVLVDFIVSAVMLLSAFQLIRIASMYLKEAGLTVTDAN